MKDGELLMTIQVYRTSDNKHGHEVVMGHVSDNFKPHEVNVDIQMEKKKLGIGKRFVNLLVMLW